VLVPEGRGIFGNLSIEENLEMAVWLRGGAWRRQWREEQQEIWELFPRLKERRQQLAFSLSGGEQQMLAIARALLLKPRLLMLDEPSMGLAPKIVSEVFHLLLQLKQKGVSILLVEQNAKAALQIADRAYVMEQGRITHEGAARDLLQDSRVIQSYLGGA
jgi:branched-chain amino acid transport system ATP-binding protein